MSWKNKEEERKDPKNELSSLGSDTEISTRSELMVLKTVYFGAYMSL